MDALDLAVEDRVRIGRDAGRRLEPVDEARLRFALRIAARLVEGAVASEALSPESRSRSVIQPSPIAAVMTRASAGLHEQPAPRRDPVGLVVEALRNISARSFATRVRRSFEWIAETPFVLCEPTIARSAMRTLGSAPSSMMLMRAARAPSPGKRAPTAPRKRRFTSQTISARRGNRTSNHLSGHFSSASGSSVWFV